MDLIRVNPTPFQMTNDLQKRERGELPAVLLCSMALFLLVGDQHDPFFARNRD